MRNFYAIFKGVLATLVATAVLTVSCTEAYDDTQIRQEIADLYEKVSKLEQKLESEVSALKALIDEKAVVASATKLNDGSWEILLTSGEKITVYPEYQPEPQAPEVNNGCVTVISEGDNYYWAQIIDGNAVAITDAAGNKIPVVHSAVPQFRVNPSTGDVELSVDGGHSWVIIEKKEQETTNSSACIFIGVVDSEDSVDFTLATGEVISVPKAETIDFGVQAGKTFVAPGESVDVALKAENIDDLTVIAKPEGWKATIAGKTLTITAPAQAKIDAGEAELEGTVKIHAAGGDGKCMVGKLVVSASSNSVVVEIAGEDATIYNNAGLKWSGISYGIALYDEFNAEQIAKDKNNYELMAPEFTEPQITVSLKQLYNEMIAGVYNPAEFVEIPTGVSYVVWALAGSDAWDHVYSADEVVYSVFTPAFVNVEATNISFNNVEFTAVGGGYAGYIVGVLSSSTEAEAKAQLENAFGNWQNDWGMFGEELTELNYKGNVLDFPGSTIWGGIYPNSTYLVYILPLVEGKVAADYVASDIKTYTYTTNDIAAGGSATLAFEAVDITYTNMEVAINGSQNTSMIYAWFANNEELANYKTDEELLAYVIAYNTEYQQIAMGNTSSAYISSLSPGASATLVAFAVDTDGKYGQLYKQEFKTKSLDYNETLKVAIDQTASKIDATSATIKVSTTGGDAVAYRFMATEVNGWSWSGEQAAEGTLALGQSYYVNEITAAELVDGAINVTDLSTNEEYVFAVLAIDAAGAPSRASFFYFTPKLPEYPLIRATSDKYAAMKPTFDYTVAWDGDYGSFAVTLNVTPAAGTAKYWIAIPDSDVLPADSPARDVVDFMILKEGQYYGSKSFTEAATIVPDYKVGRTYDVKANIFIVWMDNEGNYYEAVSAPVFTQPYIANTDPAWEASQPTIEATLAGSTLNYTVTPGAGATNMWIIAVPNRYYYDDDDLTYMLTINPEAVQSATQYTGVLAGVPEEATVAVAWTDAAGNLYQAKSVVK